MTHWGEIDHYIIKHILECKIYLSTKFGFPESENDVKIIATRVYHHFIAKLNFEHLHHTPKCMQFPLK